MLSYHNHPGTIGSLFKRLWTLFLWKRRYIKCNTLLLWDIPHANVWRRCARKNNRRVMNKNTEESDHILDLWTRYPGTAETAVPESSSRFRLATRYFSPEGSFATELKLKLWMFHERPEMFQGLVEPSSKSVEMDVSSAALKVSRQDSTINFIFVRSTAPCTTRTSYSARHSLSLSQICWHESHGHLSVDSPHSGMTKTNILNLYWAYLFNSINLSLY